MGPKITRVENKSQATPFAENFLSQLEGYLRQQSGAQTVGPKQAGGVGAGPSQQAGSAIFDKLGGTDTASGVKDYSDKLITSVTAKNASGLERDAADLREGAGIMGNRFGSGTSRGEALLRSENKLNLDQLIAGILTDQGARETQARQFDASSNNQRFSMLSGVASQGILPDEIIATPGVGSQLLSAAAEIGGAYLTGGGKLPFGGGGGEKTPKAYKNKPFGAMPKIGGGSVGEPEVYANGPDPVLKLLGINY